MRAIHILTIFCTVVGLASAEDGENSLIDLQLNRCLGKDGVFLPIPGRCNQYIICVKGTAIISTCGEYHFDARRSLCDLPSRAGCISFGPVPVNVCSGQRDGIKLPIPGNRSNYYVCALEKPVLKSCGSLQFDKETMQCVNLNENSSAQHTSSCYGIANGVKLPVAGNSRQYHLCMNNEAYLKDCGNMYFVAKYSACALEPEKTLTLSVVFPPQKLPIQHDLLLQKLCQNQRTGARVASPHSCSDYYVCMSNTAILKSCGRNQFNPINTLCEEPTKVRCTVRANEVFYGTLEQDTQFQPANTEKSNPEQTVTLSVVLPPQRLPSQHDLLLQKLCQNQRTGARVARPGSCSDYYVCMGNTAIPKSCGQNQFNPSTTLCDVPTNVRCSVRAHEVFYGEQEQETQFRPSNTEKSTSMQICAGQRDGIFLPVPGKCSDFYFCYKSQSFNKTCGIGRHFSPITLSCVELDESNCVDGDQPFAEETDAQLNNCLRRSNGAFLRHPTQCGKFVVCDNHIPVEMNCPAGLHFNLELGVCDWPEKANCVLI